LPLVGYLFEKLSNRADLLLTPDELRPGKLADVDTEARPGLHRCPGRDGLGLPFGVNELRFAVIDHVARRALRLLADEDSVHRSGSLKAGRRVDDVAGDQCLPGLGLGVERDQRLAGVDRDSHLEPVLFRRPLADCKRRADGPLGIVLVCPRGAEDRHHRVPDELLHGAAVALELGAQALVVRTQDRLHVFGVEGLGTRRESDEVDKDDRDELALAPRAHAVAESSASPSRM
jgi:hypothetical protein